MGAALDGPFSFTVCLELDSESNEVKTERDIWVSFTITIQKGLLRHAQAYHSPSVKSWSMASASIRSFMKSSIISEVTSIPPRGGGSGSGEKSGV